MVKRTLRGLFSLLRRILFAVVTLLIIAYLTLFGLIMAQRGQQGLPANPLGAAGNAFSQLFTYVTAHPTVYTWHKVDEPALQLVWTIFLRSAALLGLALLLAAAVGIPLGISVAMARRKKGAPLLLALSILGVSTPSFLLGMFLWVGNIYLYRLVGRPVLPQTGFGFDKHMILPTLVLAARPLAQIAQVTYVAFTDVLGQDYIRTARSKGLSEEAVRNRHALRNALIPILTTVGTSLRLSLASLPVVEVFFYWPGVGHSLFDAISLGMPSLVTDLVLSLGVLFLAINTSLELLYPLVDPRLGDERRDAARSERLSLREGLEEAKDFAADVAEGAYRWGHGLVQKLTSRPGRPVVHRAPSAPSQPLPSPGEQRRIPLDYRRSRWVLHSVLRNPALILGTTLVVAFCVAAIFGERWMPANPYEMHGITYHDGVLSVPPYAPSASYPWGTDYMGRDIASLVLAGAKRTLALALFGMVARVLLGTALGLIAGWWQDSRVDRLVTGAVGVWAAFPVTLFAMILIFALGIQQGMWVFVVAICVVGWGEIAQFVRGQVVAIRPQLYIEAARAVGTPPRQILVRHVLPHLMAPLLVLAVLEMGGVLMLLAELGFLGVFLGGGFRVDIGGGGGFSDVPEWGSQLASVQRWWRGYPWMAWAPGLAFFLAILAFNIWGEGLRRFVTESRANFNRLFNRYSVGVAAVLVIGLVWVLRSTAPLGVYREQAVLFDAQRALQHVQVLSSREMAGRQTGTPQARQAAQYIAAQMKEIGLVPAGLAGTYILSTTVTWVNVAEVPRLEILDAQGNPASTLSYRQDFVEFAGVLRTYGDAQGAVVGVVAAPFNDPEGKRYDLDELRLYDKIAIIWDRDISLVGPQLLISRGVLIVSADPSVMERRLLFSSDLGEGIPVMYITPAVAERLLQTAGSSLGQLEGLRKGLSEGTAATTAAGVTVHLRTLPASREQRDDWALTVIGMIPGSGADTGAGPGQGMDSQAIILGAYYDGLGVGPDGTFYPGANDNASGVAVMLEVARALKTGPFPPKKTVVFVAWPGGERGGGLQVDRVMGSRNRLNVLTVEAVVELSGVGAGSGSDIAFGQGSSFRLVQLFQSAAGRLRVGTTTRGREPHFALPMGGDREPEALTVYLSWDGSDVAAHTPRDTLETVDLDKLRRSGETAALGVTVLARERDY